MINIKKINLGFTLVELLIVIGLLGAIALIVIAAINPIEQANRARDTRFKSDAGQLISSIDRYFASKEEFPWMTDDQDLEPDDQLDFTDARAVSIGLCGDVACTSDGYLIDTNELKTEFRNRDFITDAPTVSNTISVGKYTGASSSVYACYVPLSNAERSKTENLVSLTFDANTSAPTADCTTTDWVTTPCYVCLPQ